MSLEPTQDFFQGLESVAEVLAPDLVQSYRGAKRAYNMARESIKTFKSRSRSSSKGKKKVRRSTRGKSTSNVVGLDNKASSVILSRNSASSTRALRLFVSPPPFPPKLIRTLSWRGDPYYLSSVVAGSAYYSVVVNSPYDPDYSNTFGNNSALYYDQLCSLTGPYTSYSVKRWVMTWQIMNATSSELEVFVDTSTAIANDDTVAEMRSRPFVTRVLLSYGQTDGCRSDIVQGGSIADFMDNGNTPLGSNVSAYNASPAALVYQTILVNNLRGNTALNVVLVPSLLMEVEFLAGDAVA